MTLSLRDLARDLSVLVLLILVGFVYTSRIDESLDIGLYDESNYLHHGIDPSGDLPEAENAPVYVLWYRLLSKAQPDPIRLYYLNYAAMTVLPAMMLFLALRASRVSRILALVLSLGLLCSSANFPVWPKVNHFAVSLLLAGFGIAALLGSRTGKTCVLLVTSLLVSYVRPEFFLASVLVAGLLVVHLWIVVRGHRSIRRAAAPALVLLFCLGTIAALGAPIGSGGRSMMAFGQHYARNYVRWHKDPRNPYTSWEEIVESDFGEVRSPAEAVFRRPVAVAHHVLSNLRHLPREMAALFLSTYPEDRSARLAFRGLLLLLLVAGLFRLLRAGVREWSGRLAREVRESRYSVLLSAAFLLPALLSVVLIAPRAHYCFTLGVLLVFTITVHFLPRRPIPARPVHDGVLALLFLVPFLFVRPVDAGGTQPVLGTIRFLRSLDLRVPVNLLEAEGGYGDYVGENFTRVAEFEKGGGSFGEFLRLRPIHLVVLSEGLATDSRYRDDPEWRSFVSNSGGWGFVRLDIPDHEERSLYVRADIARLIGPNPHGGARSEK